MKINRRLLPMKGHYFFLYAGLSPIAPFIPTLAKDLGFSAMVVGAIFSIVPLLSLPIKPLLGGIADKLQCQKSMFLVLLAIQGLFFYSMKWMPALPPTTKQFTCSNSTSYLTLCSDRLGADLNTINELENNYCKLWFVNQENQFNSDNWSEVVLDKGFIQKAGNCIMFRVDGSDPCQMTFADVAKITCNTTSLNQIITAPPVSDQNIVYYYQFWLLLFCIAMGKTAAAVVTSIGDTICFNILGDRPHDFGLQRLWGAKGWGLMAAISGFVVDEFSKGNDTKDYSSAFYIAVGFMILDIFISSKLEYQCQSAPPKNLIKDLIDVIMHKHIIVFLFWCILNGIYSALVWNFLFWFLEEVATINNFDMSWIKTLEGLTLTFHCYLGEIPFFFISSWLLKKIGHVHSMTLVLAAFTLRFLLYSYLTNPWWTLPIETLNGITFGIFYATMATYASAIAKPGTETTIQNLVGALFDALGVSIGSFLGGFMFQEYGASMTFWYLGLSGFFFTVLHFCVQLFMKNKSVGMLGEKGETKS